MKHATPLRLSKHREAAAFDTGFDDAWRLNWLSGSPEAVQDLPTWRVATFAGWDRATALASEFRCVRRLDEARSVELGLGRRSELAYVQPKPTSHTQLGDTNPDSHNFWTYAAAELHDLSHGLSDDGYDFAAVEADRMAANAELGHELEIRDAFQAAISWNVFAERSSLISWICDVTNDASAFWRAFRSQRSRFAYMRAWLEETIFTRAWEAMIGNEHAEELCNDVGVNRPPDEVCEYRVERRAGPRQTRAGPPDDPERQCGTPNEGIEARCCRPATYPANPLVATPRASRRAKAVSTSQGDYCA